MSELGNIIEDMIQRLLVDSVDHTLLERSEGGGWEGDLWSKLEENGLPIMLAEPKEKGGEFGWREAYLVAMAAGRHALPLPLPEAIAAGWLLALSGIVAPEGRLGLAAGDGLVVEGDTAHGRLPRVAWGRHLTHVVATTCDQVVLIPVEGCAVVPGDNLAGEPRDDLVFDGVEVLSAPCPPGFGTETSRQLGALLRSAQMAGAIATLLERSLAYAGERQQFGKLIGGFQAVQHMMAVLAEESAAAAMAAEQAFAALDLGRDKDFAIAAAKVRTGEAAGRAASIAHQVLGAMGFAREHPLHFASRRLWSWRAEFGSEAEWAERIADMVIPMGGDGLWAFVTAAQADPM
ncbi:acyl-CoA dehydrogenase domain-containing protein [Paramagnetospirillum caucaseum]|uniref:Acyl-CoA dehydrogenase domain-containing protein n=1 Tax=Paramagnetospirillum caucaseum TaxID=1244869 RepID=M3A6D3_9PROT|nr:acyl-CoA dehydrogenase family protein [Paramagnetospirillum caucaseum]EME68029.1 acyl-CoA dehydrogenase domain-containing protein [Paramagnetospirillum caucaseum]